ncbi:SPOR domain-containing protein [Oceanobacillus halophilus]|uniref:SPOR domain-containing protein n=1 Tax=Oceanobacillus halophilus TaxID=930130 RepID=A0A495AD67_9BACI|nr:SPOR domain-containing protein [Oceanobacillus halophilus]RKQ37917.1 SPOR domain-containing protein [Oceanobacillus halophilus]
MDKKKQIIVKENGKVIRKYPEKAVQTSNQESAATLHESDDDPVQSFERHTNLSKLPMKKKPSRFNIFKPIIIAASSAILIGAVLSVIMFQVLIDVESGLSGQSLTSYQPTSEGAEEEKEETSGNTSLETSSYTKEPLNAYVLQAGVFSEKENAESWSENFTELGIPTLIWQRENQYFLLLGISATKDQAQLIAEETNTGDHDLFVKEWTTSSQEMELTEQEHSWIQQFKEVWESNLSLVSEDNTLSHTSWESILTEDEQDSKALSQLSELMTNIDELSGLDAQHHLLEMMYQYEAIQ